MDSLMDFIIRSHQNHHHHQVFVQDLVLRNHQRFPPKSSSSSTKSVSLTPPPSSSSSSDDEDCSDGDYNELKILNQLCCIHLEGASRKLEIVRKQNEDLESANKVLKNRLIALLELWLSINGGGGTNNRVEPSREADPVTSPTSVIGNINQSFDEMPFQFQLEEGVSSPNSISFRSIESLLNQTNSAVTDSAAPSNTNTIRLRFAATPPVPETV